MQVKEAKENMVDLSLRLSNIIHEEKIQQEAKIELEKVVTELYFSGTKKDKNSNSKKEQDEKKKIRELCEGCSNDVDRVVQTYQLEDKEAELLEDVSAQLLEIKDDLTEKIPLGVGKTRTLDEFF